MNKRKTNILNSLIYNYIFEFYVRLVLIWVILALILDITMVTLHLIGREDLSKQVIDTLFPFYL